MDNRWLGSAATADKDAAMAGAATVTGQQCVANSKAQAGPHQFSKATPVK